MKKQALVAVVASSVVLPLLFVGLASPANAASGGNDAVKVLNSLSQKAESGSGYKRSKFTHWTSKNGCDTRASVLKAETRVSVTTNSNCTVLTGSWLSAYDGQTVTSAGALDIDHMVPLAEAWGSGAKKWNSATRTAFANDTGYDGSLIAVTASTNRSKSDRDPAEWLPPDTSYRCTYAKTWVATKWRWNLTVDTTEKRALTRILKTDCGSKLLILPARAKVKTDGGTSSSSKPSKPSSAYYKNCDAARAAGAAPVYAGQAGYGRHLDRDGDGVGCE